MTLKQKSPAAGTLEFELGDDVIILRQFKGSQRHQTQVALSSLLPEPDLRASSQRGLLYAACVVAFFIGSLLLTFPEIPNDGSRHFVVMVLMAMTGGFLFLLRRYFVSRFDVLTFFYRNGQIAFHIWRNRPDEASYSAFVGELGKRLKGSRLESASQASAAPYFSAEIDRLGALRLKGLLTDEEFARAKASLLDQLERGNRVVGFQA